MKKIDPEEKKARKRENDRKYEYIFFVFPCYSFDIAGFFLLYALCYSNNILFFSPLFDLKKNGKYAFN
jgi:hypothetical protein